MAAAQPKKVQDYIDERPIWSDGTPVLAAPMTSMQWRIWGLASAGKFFEGMVVFMTGVALPLLALEFNLDATQKGMVGAATLFGILMGATALGGLADHFGRKVMFIAEMALFTVCLIGVVLSPNFPFLVALLFGMGVALGGDYPTAHLIISESIPSRSRGRLVLGAFAFQAVGALVGTGVGLLILRTEANITDWRWMYATAVIPALLVFAGRFFIPNSGQWLFSRGRIPEAERATESLLRRSPPYPVKVQLTQHAPAPSDQSAAPKANYLSLFSKKYRRATILASIPWFLQDLGTYGIGIFTPTILAASIGAKSRHTANLAEIIHNDALGARGAALIDVLLIVGILFAVLLADKVGRMRLQVLGFLGCAAGLLLASFSEFSAGPGKIFFIFAGFMLFNFMTNLGPNAMTYLIAGEVFPTRIRGAGAGFAASFAKIGAVLTSFLFPILLKDVGTAKLLYALTFTSLVGALITWRFGIETKGINLEAVE
jgi:MFS transporter, putative metabolite transport protein